MSAKPKPKGGKLPYWNGKYWALWKHARLELLSRGYSEDEVTAERQKITEEITRVEGASHTRFTDRDFKEYCQAVEQFQPLPDLEKVLSNSRTTEADVISLIEKALHFLQAGRNYAQAVAIRLNNGHEIEPWETLPLPALKSLVRALQKTVRSRKSSQTTGKP